MKPMLIIVKNAHMTSVVTITHAGDHAMSVQVKMKPKDFATHHQHLRRGNIKCVKTRLIARLVGNAFTNVRIKKNSKGLEMKKNDFILFFLFTKKKFIHYSNFSSSDESAELGDWL